MGTDVRRLVHDGYPASRILGCDLRPEYIESGYTLYRDKGTCAIRFIAADIFDLPTNTAPSKVLSEPAAHTPDLSEVTDLSQLIGTLSHIYTGALFHLFDEETQYGLAVRLALLLKKTPGAVVFGRHQGLEKEGYIDDHLGRYDLFSVSCTTVEFWTLLGSNAPLPYTVTATVNLRLRGASCGRRCSPKSRGRTTRIESWSRRSLRTGSVETSSRDGINSRCSIGASRSYDPSIGRLTILFCSNVHRWSWNHGDRPMSCFYRRPVRVGAFPIDRGGSQAMI